MVVGVVVSGLSCGVQFLSLWHSDLSSCGAQASEHMGSVVVACGLSCSLACGILVTWSGIEFTSPALVGRFLTTGQPGKSP